MGSVYAMTKYMHHCLTSSSGESNYIVEPKQRYSDVYWPLYE